MKLNSELQKVVSVTLGLLLSDVTVELAAGDVEKWDSLGHLNLILAIEGRFKVKFETEKIAEILTVGRIQEQLQALGAFDGRV